MNLVLWFLRYHFIFRSGTFFKCQPSVILLTIHAVFLRIILLLMFRGWWNSSPLSNLWTMAIVSIELQRIVLNRPFPENTSMSIQWLIVWLVRMYRKFWQFFIFGRSWEWDFMLFWIWNFGGIKFFACLEVVHVCTFFEDLFLFLYYVGVFLVSLEELDELCFSHLFLALLGTILLEGLLGELHFFDFGGIVKHVKQLFFRLSLHLARSKLRTPYLFLIFGWKVHYFSSYYSLICWVVLIYFLILSTFIVSPLALSAILRDLSFIAGEKGRFLMLACFYSSAFYRSLLCRLDCTFFAESWLGTRSRDAHLA